jgi:hypothetical protein
VEQTNTEIEEVTIETTPTSPSESEGTKHKFTQEEHTDGEETSDEEISEQGGQRLTWELRSLGITPKE